ncbi:4'-phosphopantetheinyl transferase superfamily protein [Trinickia terrae]|uniref:4'-phosphopantetheinyl transferase superfamily protein n=1 Tax=Trinickia terrae TaxID=2571161 RepID=A0A4U1HJG8_9BURK|nr:4'-phosphopantetheinyl transferase superfamily protein [Trinickia terrae]TKC81282.1 4'-phosphopantetheinyl transferase superfamily protein [Trinickia terrae]
MASLHERRDRPVRVKEIGVWSDGDEETVGDSIDMTTQAMDEGDGGSQPQIDLWCAYPGRIDDDALLREYRRLLTEGERERGQRFRFARDQHRYLITRVLVRIVLSKYAPAVAPEQWEFRFNPYGKPEIANPVSQAAGLAFNVTHSSELVVMGVTRGIALGIDTEGIRDRPAMLDIADHYFTADEALRLRAEPAALQSQLFFEYWTLKESYVKARGMGLSIPLDRFGFQLTGERGIQMWIHPEEDDRPAHWRFWQFWPDADHVASVCAQRVGAGPASFVARTVVPLVDEHRCDWRMSRESGG